MDDLISRQAAIDEMKARRDSAKEWYDNADEDSIRIRADSAMASFIECILTLQKLPSAQPDNKVHLCDSCRYSYPDCPSEKNDVIFGNGTGNDNICACSKYEPSAQPEIIRCKDCKWWGYDDDDGAVRVCHAAKHGHMSSHWSIMIYRIYKGDYYCADAERRE